MEKTLQGLFSPSLLSSPAVSWGLAKMSPVTSRTPPPNAGEKENLLRRVHLFVVFRQSLLYLCQEGPGAGAPGAEGLKGGQGREKDRKKQGQLAIQGRTE